MQERFARTRTVYENDDRDTTKDSDWDRIEDRNHKRIELGARVRSVTKGRYLNREGVIVQIDGNTVFFKDQDSVIQRRLAHNVIVLPKK